MVPGVPILNIMFDRVCKFNIRRDGRDYIYNFKTSNGVEFDVVFEYVKAGKCNLDYKNLTEDSYKVLNYKDNTSIELFSTLVAIIEDFNNLVIPDEMVLAYKKSDPESRYKLTKKLVLFFIRKYKKKPGFEKVSYEEEEKDGRIYFYLKRNVTNTFLQFKRKKINNRG